MRAKSALLAIVALAGCQSPGVSPASSPPVETKTAVQSQTGALSCDVGTRDLSVGSTKVRMHVPSAAQPPGGLPMVMVLHGSTDDGPVVQSQTQFDEVADAQGFVTLYPSAEDGDWPLSDAGVQQINDVASSVECADPSRIYLAGFSRGSAMAFRVACTQPRLFAAFGGVAFADHIPGCSTSPPAPWIYFHGKKDQTVSYQDGVLRESGRRTPSAKSAMRWWGRHNGCQSGPTRRSIGSDTVLRVWTSCRRDADVHFYTLTKGDHQWPFAARPNAPMLQPGQSWAAVGATDEMWDFFSDRSLNTVG